MVSPSSFYPTASPTQPNGSFDFCPKAENFIHMNELPFTSWIEWIVAWNWNEFF